VVGLQLENVALVLAPFLGVHLWKKRKCQRESERERERESQRESEKERVRERGGERESQRDPLTVNNKGNINQQRESVEGCALQHQKTYRSHHLIRP
jgi:hypothetical protein